MARHRDIRNLDYDQEYDEAYDDAVYGHSVDDHEYGVSPSAEQYLYSQKGDANYGFGAYFPGTEKIKEEEEDADEPPDIRLRRDSSNFERPMLSTEDEVKLNSVLDELRNVVGDQFSEAELVRTTLENKYDLEKTLNAILNRKTQSQPPAPSKPPSSKAKKEFVAMAARPDDDMSFSPFAYMLPLSYSYSSAFCFESGKFERIALKQIIKDWLVTVSKNKGRSNKSSAKEQADAGCKKSNKAMIDSAKVFLDSTDSSDSRSKEAIFSNTNTESEEESSSFINLVSDTSENAIEDVTGRLQNIHTNDSHCKSNIIPCLKRNENDCDTGKGVNIPSSGSYDENAFCFSIPSARGIGNSLAFGSPTYSSSPKESSSPLSSSLCSAHFNDLGRSFPLGINRPGGSQLPGTISVSPLNKQSNLSALASAHFGQRANKLGDIPSFSSFGAKENTSLSGGPITLSRGSSNGSSSFQLSTLQNKLKTCSMSSTLPATLPSSLPSTLRSTLPSNLPSTLQSNLPSALPSTLPSTFQGTLPSTLPSNLPSTLQSTFRSSIPSFSQIPTFPVNNKKHGSDKHNHNSAIDLRVALLSKTKETYIDNKSLSSKDENSKYSPILINFSQLSLPPLSKEEKNCLMPRPSVLGEAILKDKIRRRSKRTCSRSVTVPFQPFDFACKSPDDIINETLPEEKKF